MKTYIARIFELYDRGCDTWEISSRIGIPRELVLKVIKGEIKTEYELMSHQGNLEYY